MKINNYKQEIEAIKTVFKYLEYRENNSIKDIKELKNKEYFIEITKFKYSKQAVLLRVFFNNNNKIILRTSWLANYSYRIVCLYKILKYFNLNNAYSDILSEYA